MVGAMTTSNTSKATITNASLVSAVTPPKAGSILSPVPGVNVNSVYGPRGGRLHAGVDMAAAEGTPLLATMDGVIGDSGYEPGYGNYVAIKHADGSIGETFYGHMEKPGEFPTGTAVKAGQVIGYMGTTGRSTGPHLHFEVRSPSGQLIDPETVMQR
jgi:murein DD-endopeptidase MepM/ murein hydrolase activator NlpD